MLSSENTAAFPSAGRLLKIRRKKTIVLRSHVLLLMEEKRKFSNICLNNLLNNSDTKKVFFSLHYNVPATTNR